MARWGKQFRKEVRLLVDHLFSGFGRKGKSGQKDRLYLAAGLLLAGVVLLGGMVFAARTSTDEIAIRFRYLDEEPVRPDYTQPVREEPRRFKANSFLPPRRERFVLDGLNRAAFIPDVDLVRIDDDRVWWESEHDRGDTEDDHLVHRSMEDPLRRLVELVDQNGGTLKVQDAYRAEGVHAQKSYHKVGRAVDVTCDELGLEKLARLAWAAGFDWVYYEAPRGGGHHVHASVRDRTRLAGAR